MGIPTILRSNVDAIDIAGGSAGRVLVDNGNTFVAVAMGTDATMASDGALTIANSAVTAAKVADTNGLAGTSIMKSASVVYDFAVDGGGAPGIITLASVLTFPNKAIVELVSYDVLTTCTSAASTATILVGLPTDGALSTAVAINAGSSPWNAGGQAASKTTPIVRKCTAARTVNMTTAVQALTAGKIVFHFNYWISQ